VGHTKPGGTGAQAAAIKKALRKGTNLWQALVREAAAKAQLDRTCDNAFLHDVAEGVISLPRGSSRTSLLCLVVPQGAREIVRIELVAESSGGSKAPRNEQIVSSYRIDPTMFDPCAIAVKLDLVLRLG